MRADDYYLVAGTLSWLISLVSFVKKWDIKFRIFSLFIFVTLAAEWYAYSRAIHGKYNIWVYNLFTMVQFIFLPLFYKGLITSWILKKFILPFVAVFLIAGSFNLIWGQGWERFNTYTYFPGSIFMLIVFLNYYKGLLEAGGRYTVLHNPFFYITTGYFLFFVIETPYTILMPVFEQQYSKGDMTLQQTDNILLLLIKILNFLLYIFIAIAFLCRPTRKQ
jgi:hypothetical protein